MVQISAKVYYLKLDGTILVVTSEMEGCVSQTTKEGDMQLYEELKGHSLDEVDFIELPYGTVAKTFINAKSYKVDVGKRQLEITYYTTEESDNVQKQNKKAQDLEKRVADIASYLQSKESKISDVENYIIQSELNTLN